MVPTVFPRWRIAESHGSGIRHNRHPSATRNPGRILTRASGSTGRKANCEPRRRAPRRHRGRRRAVARRRRAPLPGAGRRARRRAPPAPSATDRKSLPGSTAPSRSPRVGPCSPRCPPSRRGPLLNGVGSHRPVWFAMSSRQPTRPSWVRRISASGSSSGPLTIVSALPRFVTRRCVHPRFASRSRSSSASASMSIAMCHRSASQFSGRPTSVLLADSRGTSSGRASARGGSSGR